MKQKLLLLTLCVFILSACKKDGVEPEFFVNEDAATFAEIGMIDIGDVGAAEISAFDPSTNRLFVVNNSTAGNKIDVLDFANPASIKALSSISTTSYGGFVNSVAVSDGKLAAAIESTNLQANGKIVVFKTADNTEIKSITVGALPDMVTFSPDGKFILSANEGQPSDDYSNDPEGTISIIDVANNYSVTTINFTAFVAQKASLVAGGFRIDGFNKDFLKDIEPEFIAVSEDSKFAWVTLQENNGIAKIDITTKTITNIFPLGFKDYNILGNAIDVSDRDAQISLANFNVKGTYMPDALAVYTNNGIPYVFTANEGDAREYGTFADVKRMKDITLDPTIFPTRALLRGDAILGRLNIITSLGDTDNDGDYDALYSFGARSFSVWNGNTGALVFDSKNELDQKAILNNVYDDGRSDDKSVEPEGITVGKVGNKMIAFVGLERADAVAIYDITNPQAPQFLQIVKCGDAPEGILFIPAKNSPTKKSLLVVSSEGDGVVKVYTPNTII
jgi:DNA-binding beta-propeller fold protein YncE